MTCKCTYWGLIDRGFKPINHSTTCPCYNAELVNLNSHFQEEWKTEEDHQRYNELNEKRIHTKIKSKTAS